jgi:hypothetical protein
MSKPRYTADSITDDALDELYERLRKAERAADLLADSHRRAEDAEGRLLHLQQSSKAAGIYLTRVADERDALGREADRLRTDRVEQRTRAERAEAALARVQQACHELPYEHARRVLAALDSDQQPKESTTP